MCACLFLGFPGSFYSSKNIQIRVNQVLTEHKFEYEFKRLFVSICGSVTNWMLKVCWLTADDLGLAVASPSINIHFIYFPLLFCRWPSLAYE